MRKDKFVNPLMLVLSIIGGAAAYVFGEALLNFVAYWPYFLQCALYLLFVTAMCCLIMLISESIHSGNYIMRRNKEFGMTCLKAMAIMLPIAFAVGAVTQLLYGLVGLRIGGFDPDFSGTYVVCDVSGSMLDNDPDMEAVDGMIEYIDGISVRRGGEYLGVIVYSDEIYVLREYELLDSEEDKEELIELIRDTVEYGGGTNIQDALLTAIDQMRDARIKKWPGLVMLFSDGESTVDYNLLQEAALGDMDESSDMIPVNTIYFSKSQMGGSQMSMIAQKTGGKYYYLDDSFDEVSMRDAFTHSRAIFRADSPHLLQRYVGAARRAPVRIALQVLFLGIWGALTSVAVLIFLNNNRLLKSFVISRVIISFVCAIIFAVILILPEGDVGMPARALLALSMCVMFLPTYRWN